MSDDLTVMGIAATAAADGASRFSRIGGPPACTRMSQIAEAGLPSPRSQGDASRRSPPAARPIGFGRRRFGRLLNRAGCKERERAIPRRRRPHLGQHPGEVAARTAATSAERAEGLRRLQQCHLWIRQNDGYPVPRLHRIAGVAAWHDAIAFSRHCSSRKISAQRGRTEVAPARPRQNDRLRCSPSLAKSQRACRQSGLGKTWTSQVARTGPINSISSQNYRLFRSFWTLLSQFAPGNRADSI